MSINVTTPILETELFEPSQLAQLGWLFADDRRLERLFDWIVKHGQGPGTSAAMADIHAKSQGAGP